MEGQKSPCGPLTTPIILCHPQFSASSTTILDEEPIVNRGLAAALLLCQNKGEGLGAALLGPGCCGGKGRRGRCWHGLPWSPLLPLPRCDAVSHSFPCTLVPGQSQ